MRCMHFAKPCELYEMHHLCVHQQYSLWMSSRLWWGISSTWPAHSVVRYLPWTTQQRSALLVACRRSSSQAKRFSQGENLTHPVGSDPIGSRGRRKGAPYES